jgi:AcrR family transcriptional regulator
MTAGERETGEAILSAAADLFGERGYRATTTRAIAERAGVNEVTVFRRFKNKQGLLRALGESWATSMAGFAVGGLPDPSDVRATMSALARMEVTQAQRIGIAAMRLALDARFEPEVAEVLGAGPSQNLEGLTSYLTERQGAGEIRPDIDPRVMAEGFFLITSTLVMSRDVLGTGFEGAVVPVEQAAEQLVAMLLDGALVKASGS